MFFILGRGKGEGLIAAAGGLVNLIMEDYGILT